MTVYEERLIAYNYEEKGELKWSKWYNAAESPKELTQKCTHRTIHFNEVVLDIDNEPQQETYQKIVGDLDQKGLRYKAYNTGSRGYHIHLTFEGLEKLSDYERKKRKEEIILYYKCDLAKASSKVMIAQENKPHWKTGKQKELIKEKEGTNTLNDLLKYKEEFNQDTVLEELKEEIMTLILQKDRRKASEKITDYIRKKEVIYTTRDDERSEFWIYQEGIYIPQAKTYIKEYCRKILGIAYTTTISNEVIAKIETDTYIDQDEFFQVRDIWKIAVKNGVLDLKTKELLEFNPKYFFFNKIPITYQTDTLCMDIIKFLKQVLYDEKEVDVIQEIFGYLLLKEYRIEKAFMFLGSGRNGKGKTVELMKRFIGIENTCNIPIQSLSDDSFNVGELFNKMANIGADISSGVLKETGMFKSLTGRDLISAQRKFLTRVKFTNYAKMVFCANELPITYDKTIAFFNRWLILDFPYTFLSQKEIDLVPPNDRRNVKLADENVIDKISGEQEMTGLLNWAIIGLHRLLSHGDFSYSPSTSEVKNMWLRKSSSITAFIMDLVEEDFNSMISKAHFRMVYNVYCKKHKIRPISDKILRAELIEGAGASESRFREEGKDIPFWSGVKFKGGNEFGEVGEDGYGFSTIEEFVNNAGIGTPPPTSPTPPRDSHNSIQLSDFDTLNVEEEKINDE